MNEIKDQIIALIKRKKFRKWALPQDAEERIEKAVTLCVSENRPLNFVFEFGGYKLWRLPCAPYTDNAEIFMLKHYIDYLKPIAALYPPGVHLYFASDDCVVERMNNIKAEAMDIYAASFQQCLRDVSGLLPDNLHLSYVRLASLYENRQELETELARHFAVNLERSSGWSDEKKEKMRRRAVLNFCHAGPLAAQDLSTLSPAKYEERLLHGAVYHDAFENCKKRCAFVLGDDRILLFCTPIPQAVAIGTTKASVTKFWTGIGVEENGLEKVLSPSQYKDYLHAENH